MFIYKRNLPIYLQRILTEAARDSGILKRVPKFIKRRQIEVRPGTYKPGEGGRPFQFAAGDWDTRHRSADVDHHFISVVEVGLADLRVGEVTSFMG